jgi:hypothetical protein
MKLSIHSFAMPFLQIVVQAFCKDAGSRMAAAREPPWSGTRAKLMSSSALWHMQHVRARLCNMQQPRQHTPWQQYKT